MDLGSWTGFNEAAKNIGDSLQKQQLMGMQQNEQVSNNLYRNQAMMAQEQQNQAANAHQDRMYRMENNKLPYHRQEQTKLETAQVLKGLKDLGLDGTEVFNQIKIGGDTAGMTKGDVYGLLSSNPDFLKQNAVDKKIKDHMRAMENPMYANSPEAAKNADLIKTLESIPGTEFVNGLYGKTAESIATEQANTKAALEASRNVLIPAGGELYNPVTNTSVRNNKQIDPETANRVADRRDAALERKRNQDIAKWNTYNDVNFIRPIAGWEKEIETIGRNKEIKDSDRTRIATLQTQVNEHRAQSQKVTDRISGLLTGAIIPDAPVRMEKYNNQTAQSPAATVVRTGVDGSGKKVEQLSDGTVRYVR